MPQILHIEASPRGAASVSTSLAAAFLDDIRRADPAGAIDRLDVWSEDLPAFDGDVIDAKYAKLAGRPLTDAQAAAWADIAAMVARLDAADAILLSTPMWNFNIPYRLKHWIDLVTQPGLSFSFNPVSGYTPLLRDRPVIVLLASAGDYSQGESFGRPDLASGYLQAALRFIGLANTAIVPVGPTVGQPDRIAAGQATARERLAALVPAFAGALR